MVEFDNPVSRAIFVRFVGPLVPVWLAGAALMFLLNRLTVEGPPLTAPATGLLLGIYSILVAALVSLLYYREWGHSPVRLELSVDGVSGRFLRSRRPEVSFSYGRILRIQPPGYFVPRVEARSEGGGSVEWINLTEENALRLAEAWGAWRERDERGLAAA